MAGLETSVGEEALYNKFKYSKKKKLVLYHLLLISSTIAVLCVMPTLYPYP